MTSLLPADHALQHLDIRNYIILALFEYVTLPHCPAVDAASHIWIFYSAMQSIQQCQPGYCTGLRHILKCQKHYVRMSAVQ